MPKISPWSRRKPLISWEKLGTEALNNYDIEKLLAIAPKYGIEIRLPH
jgi:hypothetical protein